MRHRKALFASLCIVLSSALSGAGCQDCDTTVGDPVDFDEGSTSPDRLHYESTPVDGEWLHFPPGRSYALEHDLRAGSINVKSYVTFPDNDGAGKNPSSFAESAGNQVIYEPAKASDARHIVIRNDTCAEYFVRVVADVTPDTGMTSVAGSPGASGASGS